MIAGCIASNILISPVRQHTAVHCIDASIQLLMIVISISYLSHLCERDRESGGGIVSMYPRCMTALMPPGHYWPLCSPAGTYPGHHVTAISWTVVYVITCIVSVVVCRASRGSGPSVLVIASVIVCCGGVGTPARLGSARPGWLVAPDILHGYSPRRRTV